MTYDDWKTTPPDDTESVRAFERAEDAATRVQDAVNAAFAKRAVHNEYRWSCEDTTAEYLLSDEYVIDGWLHFRLACDGSELDELGQCLVNLGKLLCPRACLPVVQPPPKKDEPLSPFVASLMTAREEVQAATSLRRNIDTLYPHGVPKAVAEVVDQIENARDE